MASRRGGLLRNLRRQKPLFGGIGSMAGMARSIFNPDMQAGIMGTNPDMIRSMKARMMGLPDPQDFDANNLPFPLAGQSLDIMPKDAVMPKQPPQIGVAPNMTSGNAALLPTELASLPPKPPIMMDMQGRRYMSGGGGANKEEPKEYPNEGLAALAASGEKGKEAVKAMGYANGGEISLFEIYSRLQKSMGQLSKNEMDLLKDMYSDGRYSAGDMIQKVKDFRSGKFMPRKFEDLETKRNRLSRTMGTGETAQRAKAMGRSLPNQTKALANAIMKVSPTIRMPVAAGRGMLGRLAGPVTAGLGALSFMDYYNKLRNPEPETITLTQEEFDEMRRRAND